MNKKFKLVLVSSVIFTVFSICSCGRYLKIDYAKRNGKTAQDYDTSNNVEVLSFGTGGVKFANLSVNVTESHNVTMPSLTHLELESFDSDNVTTYDIVDAYFANPDGSANHSILSGPITLEHKKIVNLDGFDHTNQDEFFGLNYDNAVLRLITEDSNISILIHKPKFNEVSNYYNSSLSKEDVTPSGTMSNLETDVTSFRCQNFSFDIERMQSIYFDNSYFCHFTFLGSYSKKVINISDMVLSFDNSEETISLIEHPITFDSSVRSEIRFRVKDADANKYKNANGNAYLTIFSDDTNFKFTMSKK